MSVTIREEFVRIIDVNKSDDALDSARIAEPIRYSIILHLVDLFLIVLSQNEEGKQNCHKHVNYLQGEGRGIPGCRYPLPTRIRCEIAHSQS